MVGRSIRGSTRDGSRGDNPVAAHELLILVILNALVNAGQKRVKKSDVLIEEIPSDCLRCRSML